MNTTFSEYRIPKDFFGPLQVVDYDGIAGTINVDDVEFRIQCAPDRRGKKVDMKKLEQEVPEIVDFYKKQTLISIKSKAIKKQPKK